MTSNCRALRVASDRAGDDHYRMFTDWVISRLRGVMLTNCLAGAHAYKTALDELLACLEKRQHSPEIQKQIVITLEYLLLIDEDISVLQLRSQQ
jgi:hypothetical protein